MSGARIYTDGGCHGNPGPGAWAYVMLADTLQVERSGAQEMTTNNRMELEAVIHALEDARNREFRSGLVVHTDSQYVKNGITTWIHTWMRNGWRTSAKTPVKNQDLWVRLNDLARELYPSWEWVKGHSGDPANERCDSLVQEAIRQIEKK